MNLECNIIGPIKSNVILKEDLFSIFVDGGMSYSKGFTDFISVGDSDSWEGKHDHQLSKDKDRNDLFHGLNLVPKECKKINARGFYGERIDHFLINLGEFDHFLRQNQCQIDIYDEDGLAISAFSLETFKVTLDGTFSLFAFEDTLFSINGSCKYTTGMEYTKLIGRSGHGLSNIGYGKITIRTQGPIFLFYNQAV